MDEHVEENITEIKKYFSSQPDSLTFLCVHEKIYMLENPMDADKVEVERLANKLMERLN